MGKEEYSSLAMCSSYSEIKKEESCAYSNNYSLDMREMFMAWEKVDVWLKYSWNEERFTNTAFLRRVSFNTYAVLGSKIIPTFHQKWLSILYTLSLKP